MESQLTRDSTSQYWTPRRRQRPLVRTSFMIGIFALLIFLALALVVLRQLPLLGLDTSVALFLKEYAARHGGVRVMRLVSGLADPGVLILGAAGVALLAYRRRLADLALWVTALAGGLVLNTTIKQLFDGFRPAWADPLRLGHEWQFPSGHVLGATVCYSLIVLLSWPKCSRLRQRIALLVGLVGLLLLIGFSRLYLRDHYLGDVLAGYAVGLSWLAACIGVWAAYLPARSVLQ
jgi:membrane-associated phospholipid phosphatase